MLQLLTVAAFHGENVSSDVDCWNTAAVLYVWHTRNGGNVQLRSDRRRVGRLVVPSASCDTVQWK